MRARDIKDSVKTLVEAKIALFLWGAPGIGKSSIIKEVARDLDIECIDLRLSLFDPTDLKGIPYFDNHSASWAAPSFLPRDGEGILFLDELNLAAPAVQASAYQLILDRRVGEYVLPDGWAMVAAGNREGDRGIVYKLPSPLANRFVHLEMDVDVDDWRDWAIKSSVDERIIAYIGFKREMLFRFDPAQKSFATPRSWEAVDKILKSKLDKKLYMDVIGGAVGTEAAIDFLAFIKIMDKLPDIDAILDGSENAVAEDIESLYALSSALVMRVLSDKSDESISNLLRYSLKLKNEFALLIVQDLQRQGVMMDHLDAYGEWVEAFSHLL